MTQKLLVTSALPYASGPIHLGHIAGAYLPADIYVRFNRLIGNDVVYICGTDEHGVPITLRAEKENVTPRVIVKRYHEDIKKAFERLNISFDNFSGTSNIHNKHHARVSREFFMKIYQQGLIVSHLADQHYCTHCQRFLADRFIQGVCPRCGYPEARGDECSKCNHQFEAMELKEPRCKICTNTPEIRSTKHWYLRLDVLQKELQQWLATRTYWKENVYRFVKEWLEQGLKERPITRDLYWGVPVPLDDAAGKVLYVWFEAPIGYITSTMEWAERKGKPDSWKEYWQNPECRIVHFIGKDNVPFHAVIWPATLMATRENYELPWEIPANEYLNFGVVAEDAEKAVKASKSKGNVVWVHECLDLFPADAIRYYLAASAPEKRDTLFTWRDFQKRHNTELLGILGNLANRVLKFVENRFSGTVPAPGKWTDRDREILDKIRSTAEVTRDCYGKFEVRAAAAEILALGRLGNQYFDEKAPWKTVKEDLEDCKTCLYVGTQLINTLAVTLYPIIPESALKLWRQLGHDRDISAWEESIRELPGGHKIGKPEGLFQKVEDPIVVELEQKLSQAIHKSSS